MIVAGMALRVCSSTQSNLAEYADKEYGGGVLYVPSLGPGGRAPEANPKLLITNHFIMYG